jgi:AcrR family transcriptional regulator
VDEIATLAGVSRATFYFHFPSKDDVLALRLSRSQAAISQELRDMPDATSIEQILRLTANRIGSEWADDPELLREVGTVAIQLTAQDIREATRQHPVQLALIPRFQASVQRREIEPLIPAELLTEFFLVNVFGAALTWCANPEMAPLVEVLDAVVTFFMRGARPLPE